MTVSRPVQFGIWGALALLMVVTRGQHFASINALPSASWAIFLLAGIFLRPLWMALALIALASTLDLAALESGKITDWCLSPAYWATLVAYGSLWLAGRVYARLHRDHFATLLPLGLSMIVGAFVAYLCSGGGFYFFSGRYPEPTLAGFLPRIAHYYPLHMGNLGFYVGLAAAVYVVARLLRTSAAPQAAR